MNSTAVTLEPAFMIEGFPRLDRYFPQCKCSAVEALSSFLYGISDFGKIYGGHTFVFRKPEGPIHYRANGVELDLEIHRVPLLDGELEARIESVYGVRIDIVLHADFRSYWDACMDGLKRGRPVITDFDLRFVRGRREYGKVDNPHIIVLHGYDPVKRVFTAAEQTVGTISVELGDFTRCFEHVSARKAAMRVLDVSRVRDDERSLERDEVLAQIRTNLQNLGESSDERGLGGLARFRSEMGEYLSSDAFVGGAFSVPGLWVFSHERHIVKKWLKAITHLLPESRRAELVEFDELLSRLFKRWLNTDFLMEKCLITGNGAPLRSMTKYLDLIVPDEHEALERWSKLERAIVASSVR